MAGFRTTDFEIHESSVLAFYKAVVKTLGNLEIYTFGDKKKWMCLLSKVSAGGTSSKDPPSWKFLLSENIHVELL
jgi:hypothetical protein